MALTELRALSATSYFRSTVAIQPYLGGDLTFTAAVLMRELGPTSVTQFICGNALGSSGWSFVRTSDSNSGATHNYTFTVFENAVAQTVSFAIPGSVGKMMLFHLAYAGGAPGSLTVYVNGIELITGATSSNAITASLGRFSVGFNFNATTQPNPDMGFVAFGYVNTTFTAQVIADNTAACIKAQEISNGGLTPAWQYLYSVARDSGSGVPSVLRNFGTVLSTSTLDVVGRTSMQLSSPPSFLGDSVRIQSAVGGGNVSGPGVSTNNAIATFNGITGDTLQNTLVTIAPGTGNIATPGTVDGRDISVDGTKLDTIATGATSTPLSAVAPVNVTKSAAAVGVATTAARSDHKHDITTAAAVSITDSTNGEGVATSLARSDHTHAHGTRGGGTLHAVATDSVAGFMSAADKTKLDNLPGGGGSVDIFDIYVSAANGNDANDGADPGTPVQTLTRAQALVPMFPTQPVVIHIGAGSYVWADITAVKQGSNAPLYIWGDGAGQPGDDGFTVLLSGAAGVGSTAINILETFGGINAVAGYTIEFTSGALIGQRRTIRSNTTTALVPCATFTAAPAPGDTFDVKHSDVHLTNLQEGANVGTGIGFSQVESPLVLINLLFEGSNYETAWRMASTRAVLYGVQLSEGGLTCIDSTIHAGTLYANAANNFGAFGNFLPFQGTNDPGSYFGIQLALLSDDNNAYNWQGWGLSVRPEPGDAIPLVMDSGIFAGYLVGAQLTVSPASKVALVGGAIFDNSQASSGQLINDGGYLHIQSVLTQRLSSGSTLNAPNVPFLITTGAGGKTALSTINGGYTLVDTLVFSTNAASISVVTSGMGSNFVSTGIGAGVTQVSDAQFLDGATASFAGTLGLSGSTHTVTVDGATLLLDGPAGQFGTVALSNNAVMTVISTGVFRTATALSVLGGSYLNLQSYIDFDGPITITDSKMFVSKTSSLTTADLGTSVTLTNSELNLAAYPNALRINNGGSATATVLTMVNSKLFQTGMQLTITGRTSMTANSVWQGSGAIGTCVADRITCTNSTIRMMAASGSWTIEDTAPSLALTSSYFQFTGAALTIGGGVAGLELTATADSTIVVATSGAVLVSGQATLTNSEATFTTSPTLTFANLLTLDNTDMEVNLVAIVLINQGVDSAGFSVSNGSKFVQHTSRVSVDGGAFLRRSSQWIAIGNINGTNLLDGMSLPAIQMQTSSVFDMSAVTSGSFVFDADTAVNPVVITTSAIAHLISANVDVTGAPATAAMVTAFGGGIYFTGVLPGFTATGTDFADTQGGFSIVQVNFAFTTGLYGALMEGNHPGGTWNATDPGQGSSFVRRIS